jgi:hypothetical protein
VRALRGCAARDGLADPRCTPGATAIDDLEILCHQPTTGRRCNFSKATRETIFRAYGLPYPEPKGAYEVDHLIPLELGGANSLANVWPEAAEPKPGFHQKDWLENELHRRVCSGEMDLAAARKLIAHNWVTAYQCYLSPACLRGGASMAQ